MKVHRSSQELQETIEGYKMVIEEQKKDIWELKQIASENEKNKNLLQGYKKVIEDLSAKLRQKDS
jgi:predicted ribosome quality control (RQC) complex YloA/Tae2 family protein